MAEDVVGLNTPPVQPVSPAPGADMGSLIEGAPGVDLGPPRDQQHFEERKQGWQAFAQRLNSDPEAQKLMLNIGLRLMQPLQPGMTPGGHLAGSVGDALQYTDEWTGKQKEEARRAALAQSEIARNTDQVATNKQNREFAAQVQPYKVATASTAARRGETDLEQETFNLARAKQELNALNAAGMTSPEFLRRKAYLEEQIKLADANLKNLHAAAYGAAADVATGGGGSGKNTKQIMHSAVDDNGAINTTYMVNGRQYFSRVEPPMPADQALKRAEREVTAQWKAQGRSPDPGFFSSAGEREQWKQAIQDRAQQLIKGSSQHFDENHRPVNPPETQGEPSRPATNRPQPLTSASIDQATGTTNPGATTYAGRPAEIVNVPRKGSAPMTDEERQALEAVGTPSAQTAANAKSQELKANEAAQPGKMAQVPTSPIEFVTDPKSGKPVLKSRLNAGSTETSTTPAENPDAQFIKTVPRSSSVTIDAPARSPLRALNGRKFASREEALAAMAAIRNPSTQMAGQPSGMQKTGK